MQDISDSPNWEDDLLGYKDVAQTFTRLIKTIDDTKVISIEAGYGRGKTFFRERWAEHMRAEGEVVVEVDAHLSDHSGDPVVTFIGALLDAVPKADKEVRKKTLERGKKIAGMAGKAALGYVAKSMANEIVEEWTEAAADQVEGMETLEQAVDDMGKGLSKLAGKLIEGQLAAEQVRQKELPEQLSALRDALTKEAEANRVIILIDELDRCHPDYAIAFLEAMKLVFAHEGFVFCLLVNAEYLEGLAAHRFGEMKAGERYLDKFLDIRLSMPSGEVSLSKVAIDLAMKLPLGVPYGDGPEFSVDRAAKLAGELAPASKLSMRQVKRLMTHVELVLRCYSDQPMDCALLVFFAFEAASGREFSHRFLPRSILSKSEGERLSTPPSKENLSLIETLEHEAQEKEWERGGQNFVRENCQELLNLPEARYRLPDNQNYFPWFKVCKFLAPFYHREHKEALNGVRALIVDTGA